MLIAERITKRIENRNSISTTKRQIDSTAGDNFFFLGPKRVFDVTLNFNYKGPL